MKKTLLIISLFSSLMSCAQRTATTSEEKKKIDKPYAEYTSEDWKQVLTDEEYYVLREKGTERPFTGDLLDNKKKGTYVCAACSTPLYDSKTKFKSGTGWPSFYDAIDGNVGEIPDNSYGMTRVEIVCNTCKGHLGHVFTDGPKPTGLRHCVNSLSLDFEEADE